jgi:hypothetical protein
VEIVGLLKNTLRPNTKKGITKEQHITNPCFRWNCGLLKNTLRSNTKKGITKEQHITQSLLYKLGRTVENT